jgi:hypothetical protein
VIFLDCPAYLDENGAARCGLPAEVRCRFTMSSTDGPLECAMIRCPVGHWFNGPIGSLTRNGSQVHDPGHAAAPSRARPASVTDSDHGRDGRGGSVRDIPGKPGQAISRPNGAPAYYLGRPARLWITVMSPPSSRAASTHPLDTAPGSWDERHPRTAAAAPAPGSKQSWAAVVPDGRSTGGAGNRSDVVSNHYGAAGQAPGPGRGPAGGGGDD